MSVQKSANLHPLLGKEYQVFQAHVGLKPEQQIAIKHKWQSDTTDGVSPVGIGR